MKTILNLSDVAITIVEQGKLENVFGELASKGKDIDEIFIGSYFCEKYFLHLTKDIVVKIMDLCRTIGCKFSLVVPMSSEKDLQRVKDNIATIVQVLSTNVSSIVVNDFGMMEYIARKYAYPIVFGRLLYKQLRDSRYETLKDENPPYEICSQQLHNLIKEYPIKAFELDAVGKNAIIHNSFGYEVYAHSPMVYMSTGMVCEYASAGLSNTDKFRPNVSCAHQCSRYCTEYVGANNKHFYKFGRTIYYYGESLDSDIAGVDKELYCPFESVGECYENPSSIKQ